MTVEHESEEFDPGDIDNDNVGMDTTVTVWRVSTEHELVFPATTIFQYRPKNAPSYGPCALVGYAIFEKEGTRQLGGKISFYTGELRTPKTRPLSEIVGMAKTQSGKEIRFALITRRIVDKGGTRTEVVENDWYFAGEYVSTVGVREESKVRLWKTEADGETMEKILSLDEVLKDNS